MTIYSAWIDNNDDQMTMITIMMMVKMKQCPLLQGQRSKTGFGQIRTILMKFIATMLMIMTFELQ